MLHADRGLCRKVSTFTDRWAAQGFLFVLPALFFVAVFIVVPVVLNLVLAFTNYRASAIPYRFIGLMNFQSIFTDSSFWLVLGNTFKLLLIYVVVTQRRGGLPGREDRRHRQGVRELHQVPALLPLPAGPGRRGVRVADDPELPEGSRERVLPQPRARFPRPELAGREGAGHPRHQPRHRVVRHRVLHHHLLRGSHGHFPRVLRGGDDRRGERHAEVPVRHPAAAGAGHHHQRGAEHHGGPGRLRPADDAVQPAEVPGITGPRWRSWSSATSTRATRRARRCPWRSSCP